MRTAASRDVARTAEVRKSRFLEEITKARAAVAIAQAEAARAKLQQRKDERGGKTKVDRKKRATNPKKKFSLAHRLYEVYKAATTVADFMTLGGTATYLREDFYAGYLTYLDKGDEPPPKKTRPKGIPGSGGKTKPVTAKSHLPSEWITELVVWAKRLGFTVVFTNDPRDTQAGASCAQ
ncbi:hypothetical protein M885DRAFT_580485 [Pelagophyceae sp. CCMP2097]|nr:hypothetical protein M885DRAFT_580485 [Pelagophyceae sp. CCMP2097]